MPESKHNRRNFLKTSTILSAGAVTVPATLFAQPKTVSKKGGEGYTFLFQGDSITDGNRTRNNDWNHVMGHGYAYIIASRLWYEHPEKAWHFFNRGISGNKLPELAARWQKDTIEIKPDVLSILVGINDTAVFLEGKTAFTTEVYENDYRTLLQQTRAELPDVQLIICEPFILKVGKVKDKWNTYLPAVQERQAVAAKLAAEFNAVYVRFQQAFDKALSRAPAEYWIWDGIHPMPAGHELMAREWINEVSKKLKFIKH